MTVREHLYALALRRGLRQSTLLSYERHMKLLGLLDREVGEVGEDEAVHALWAITPDCALRILKIGISTFHNTLCRDREAVPSGSVHLAQPRCRCGECVSKPMTPDPLRGSIEQ